MSKFFRRIRLAIAFGLGIIILIIVASLLWWRLDNKVRAQNSQTADYLLHPTSLTISQGETFSLHTGINTDTTLLGIDNLLTFDSSLLEVVNVATGSSELKTLVPGNDNLIDLSRAVTIDATDSTRSTLEFGLVAFDLTTDQPTAGINGQFDPATNPLATITLRGLAVGAGTIKLKYLGAGDTSDANTVALIDNQPTDILASLSAQLIVTVTSSCGLTYDYSNEGRVDIADMMQVASRWNSQVGDGRYIGRFDSDQDGDIDIQDIQRLTATWGSSCQ